MCLHRCHRFHSVALSCAWQSWDVGNSVKMQLFLPFPGLVSSCGEKYRLQEKCKICVKMNNMHHLNILVTAIIH